VGASPRRLVKIKGEGTPPQIGESILNTTSPPSTIGQVTSLTKDQNEFLVLGLIKKFYTQKSEQVQFANTPGSKGTVMEIAE
jgi:folate-binding Fe-S cluster repair protein YgfZ